MGGRQIPGGPRPAPVLNAWQRANAQRDFPALAEAALHTRTAPPGCDQGADRQRDGDRDARADRSVDEGADRCGQAGSEEDALRVHARSPPPRGQGGRRGVQRPGLGEGPSPSRQDAPDRHPGVSCPVGYAAGRLHEGSGRADPGCRRSVRRGLRPGKRGVRAHPVDVRCVRGLARGAVCRIADESVLPLPERTDRLSRSKRPGIPEPAPAGEARRLPRGVHPDRGIGRCRRPP